MTLTILAIPFMILGLFISPFDRDGQRCFSIKAAGAQTYCFEQGSNMPEIVKYGLVAVGFGLLYAGRHQIRRRREGK